MKSFELNGKKVIAKDIDFNAIAELQEMGVDIFADKGISSIRGYVAYCLGIDKEEAGKEIEAHIIASDCSPMDALNEIASVMAEKIGESGFFRKVIESQTKEVTQSENETTVTEKKTRKK